MKKLVLAVLVLAGCSLCWGDTPSAAQVNNQADSNSPLGPADCAFTFTSGTGNTFMKYCVTADGNISEFQTPEGIEHIAVGTIGEGYGICDFTADRTHYFDYSEFGESENWGPATVVRQTGKSLKIARTTSDGVWTLTQTFSQAGGSSPSLKIAMALKNNTDVNRDVALLRYVNASAGSVTQNNLDAVVNDAFAWDSVGAGPGAPFGLELQNVSASHFTVTPFVQNVPDGPSPCSPNSHLVSGPLSRTDGSLVLFYNGTVLTRASRTMTLSYNGF